MRHLKNLSASVLLAVFSAIVAIFMTGGAVGAQESVDDPAQVEAGQAVYETSCMGCHAEGGVGSQNGPPLTDAANRQDRAAHIKLISEGGGGMPAFSGGLSGEEIEQVASYVRLTFTAQSDAAEDEDSMDELPFTGANENIALAGLMLVFGGTLLLAVGERALRRLQPLASR